MQKKPYKNEIVKMPNNKKNSVMNNWSLVKLEDVIRTIIPPKKIQKRNFKIGKSFPIIDQSQKEIAGWTNDKNTLIKADYLPLIIFGDHTCCVKYIERPFAQGADGIKIIKVNESLVTKFIYFYLKFNPIKSSGYSRNFSKLKKIKIPLPPLFEQKRIVEILSTWDQAIETINKLTSAKEKQFKWLLKKLITDQKNNPNWKKTKLGEIGVISSSGVDKKNLENEEEVKLVNFLDVLNKNFICSNDLAHWVTAPKNKVTKCSVKKGDIFFTPSSEIQGDIAHSAVAMEDIDKAVYSYHIIRLRLKENWSVFFRAYIFKQEHFYKQACSLCQGSGQRYVISLGDFKKMTIYYPTSILEQNKIGNILNEAEKEIETLKQLSKKYEKQKKGLMQKLLTGEIKV